MNVLNAGDVAGNLKYIFFILNLYICVCLDRNIEFLEVVLRNEL